MQFHIKRNKQVSLVHHEAVAVELSYSLENTTEKKEESILSSS